MCLTSAFVISLCNRLSFASHGCTNPTDVSRMAGDYNFHRSKLKIKHTLVFSVVPSYPREWRPTVGVFHDDACSRNQEVHSIAASKFAMPAPVPSASADAFAPSPPSPGVSPASCPVDPGASPSAPLLLPLSPLPSWLVALRGSHIPLSDPRVAFKKAPELECQKFVHPTAQYLAESYVPFSFLSDVLGDKSKDADFSSTLTARPSRVGSWTSGTLMHGRLQLELNVLETFTAWACCPTTFMLSHCSKTYPAQCRQRWPACFGPWLLSLPHPTFTPGMLPFAWTQRH